MGDGGGQRLRDLLLSPTRQSTLATERVRAGAEASETRSEAGELLLLSLLQVESREADSTVVRAALRLRRRAVGVVSGVHRHAVGDVDALVSTMAVLRLVGNVKSAGAG